MASRFWSDNFDMDLLKVIPGVDAALAPHADTLLWTYGHTTHGRLNHPSVWNTYQGSAAWFGTDETGDWKPEELRTDSPLVQCTWREAVRDAWPHAYLLIVDRTCVWDAARLRPAFDRLMYDLRGWQPLPHGRADTLRRNVLARLHRATRVLGQLLNERNHQ